MTVAEIVEAYQALKCAAERQGLLPERWVVCIRQGKYRAICNVLRQSIPGHQLRRKRAWTQR